MVRGAHTGGLRDGPGSLDKSGLYGHDGGLRCCRSTTVSLVTDKGNLFNRTSDYPRPAASTSNGPQDGTERPCRSEWSVPTARTSSRSTARSPCRAASSTTGAARASSGGSAPSSRMRPALQDRHGRRYAHRRPRAELRVFPGTRAARSTRSSLVAGLLQQRLDPLRSAQTGTYIQDQYARTSQCMGGHTPARALCPPVHQRHYWGMYSCTSDRTTPRPKFGGDNGGNDAQDRSTPSTAARRHRRHDPGMVRAANRRDEPRTGPDDPGEDARHRQLHRLDAAEPLRGNQDLKTDGNWRAPGGGPDRPLAVLRLGRRAGRENVNQTGTSPSGDPTGWLTVSTTSRSSASGSAIACTSTCSTAGP